MFSASRFQNPPAALEYRPTLRRFACACVTEYVESTIIHLACDRQGFKELAGGDVVVNGE
jgi:hypothetical protein